MHSGRTDLRGAIATLIADPQEGQLPDGVVRRQFQCDVYGNPEPQVAVVHLEDRWFDVLSDYHEFRIREHDTEAGAVAAYVSRLEMFGWRTDAGDR